MMGATVTLPVEQILSSRGLGPSSGARKYLAQRVRVRCDKYVPYDTGRLKNTAQISGDGATITYVQPYAEKQFYVNYYHTDPNRGHQWHKRMLAAEGSALVGDMQAYLGR